MRAADKIRKRPSAPPSADPLELPAFLRLTQDERRAARQAFVPPPDWTKNDASLAASISNYNESRRLQSEAKAAKRRALAQRKLHSARQMANPAAPWRQREGFGASDYTRIRNELYAVSAAHLAIFDNEVQYDERTRRYLYPQPTASAASAASTRPHMYTYNAKAKRARSGANGTKPVSANDDTALRLLSYDRDQLLALAKANGLYKPVYETLPNPGLVRMTVGNRIRAKARRQETIKWL